VDIDWRAAEVALMQRLGKFAGESGADLAALPAYNANITNWRAVARLAGAAVEHTTRAG
jgi:hypothetical protein